MEKIDYNKARKKLNSDLERYQIIVDYFKENPDRVEDNYLYLPQVYSILASNFRYKNENLISKVEQIFGGKN